MKYGVADPVAGHPYEMVPMMRMSSVEGILPASLDPSGPEGWLNTLQKKEVTC